MRRRGCEGGSGDRIRGRGGGRAGWGGTSRPRLAAVM